MLPAQTLTRGFSARASQARSIVERPVLRLTAPMEVVMRTSLRRSRESKHHRSRKHSFEIDFRRSTTDKESQVRSAHFGGTNSPRSAKRGFFVVLSPRGATPHATDESPTPRRNQRVITGSSLRGWQE